MDTKKLRQKILDLAIHGKLVPQDPNDEPASVLLERIKAEKERLIKEGKIKRSKKSAKTSDTPHYENVPFEVPEGWVWCKLEEICHIAGRIGFRGYTKEDLVNKGNGAITLSPSNIIDGEMNYSKCTYISWKKYEESPEIQICNGDILLVKTGSSFGKCAFVRNLPQEATINPQFVVIKYIGCNKEYLTFVLQSQYARNNYDSFVLGTAIPTFTQAALGDMLIPLPPIHEQNNIVKEVKYREVLINIINCNQEDLASSIEQTKSKILDLAIHGKLVPQDPNDEPAIELLKRINPDFTPCDNGQYGKIPQGWILAKLGDLFDAVSAKRVLKSEWRTKGVPFYRAREIVKLSEYNKVNNELFIEDKHYDKLKNRYGVPASGDIMLSAVGTIGKCYIVKESDKFYYKDASVLCLKNHHKLSSMYFSMLFSSSFIEEQIKEYSKGTTVDTITLEKLKSYIVPLPPLAEQQRIVQKIEELFSVLDNIQNALEV